MIRVKNIERKPTICHHGKNYDKVYRGSRLYYEKSPYSKEATNILKAAFPSLWKDIRDYGNQHPQLVEFINQDPMLICSLVEGTGKVRYARGGVSCQVSTGIVPTTTMTINAMFRMNKMTMYHPAFQQGYISDSAATTRAIVSNGQTDRLLFNIRRKTSGGGNAVINFGKTIQGEWVTLHLTDTTATANGITQEVTLVDRGSTNNNPIQLFGRGDTYGAEDIDFAYFETIDGGERHTLVPYQIGEQCYLLDLATCELTKGQFTIAITDKA